MGASPLRRFEWHLAARGRQVTNMFRRPLLVRRHFFRRPLLGAALAGSVGFAIGRRRAPSTSVVPALSAELQRLAELHASGAIDTAEFDAAKRRLLGE